MSKAEEAALQEYPKIIKRYRKLGDTEENTGSEYDENLEQRCIYIKGYHQAEQDNELNWEDIKTIDKLLNQCVDYSNPYQEVLKRFKNLKKWEQENMNTCTL